VTAEEVEGIITRMVSKSCRLDPIPTSLLKDLRVTVAPYISRIANMSFTTGIFPKELKFAEVSPIVKKIGLPTDDLSSYRSISNLSSLSKILEKL